MQVEALQGYGLVQGNGVSVLARPFEEKSTQIIYRKGHEQIQRFLKLNIRTEGLIKLVLHFGEYSQEGLKKMAKI